MEKEAALYSFLKALVKVQGLIEPTKTDSTNPHFKSKYASLTAVNASVMGILNENGFALVSGGTDIGGKPYLRTTLYHEAGHSETFVYPLVVSDNPQHTASSLTYARRYSICALLNLSVEEDDGEAVATVKRAAASVTPAVAKVFAPKKPEESGFEVSRFVPSFIEMKPGKGKGEGKMFSEIHRSDGAVFGGNEMQGELAQSALNQHKEIIVYFERNGKWLNAKKVLLAEPVKETVPPSEDISDVGF